MITLSNLFSSCIFGHARDPLTIVVKGKQHHQCRRCQADLGAVLPGLKFKKRKEPKKAKVLKLTRKSA